MTAQTGAPAASPDRCVVLVPFSGFIHGECEIALQELERRGYVVRRVGGYASIDAARSQMATDALRDGFEDTFWIDSDVGFDPDDVDRLRAHHLPIVCGIYPKKGQRAIACHILPGTESLLFGRDGGLIELLYAATGFLRVRREVYVKMQEQLGLPTCNEAFGHPLVPYFQPIIRPLAGGHWYMSEDYSFCHRARECGYSIFADTRIRLWHIGTYRYGWEDAGIEPARFETFHLNLKSETPPPENGRPQTLPTPTLQELAAQARWPASKPTPPRFPQRDWFFPSTRDLLGRSLSRDARLVVEIGSWTGRSTRFIADTAPSAAVIAIDHWEGSAEHHEDSELAAALPHLYETFLAECWAYRDRIIPLRDRSVAGLRRIRELNLEPDLIYIDGDHSHDAVVADLSTALDLFPRSVIVGDDWDWEGVRTAVETVAKARGLQVDVLGSAWRTRAR